MRAGKLFDFVGAPLLIAGVVVLYLIEKKRPLRHQTQPHIKRLTTNAAIAALSMPMLRFGFIPIVIWLAKRNQTSRFGLNRILPTKPLLRNILAFLILDYSNYWWHILNHRSDLLWRIHRVHHTDLDLDVLTSVRFHVGELVGSVFYRGFFTVISGASPRTTMVYEIAYEAATNFHHSNLRLPLWFEKMLNMLFVTPRMHGIHHSIVERETDSNFSVIFSLWDRLHQTLNLGVCQRDITIGIPAFRDPNELKFTKLVVLPLQPTRKWQLPDRTVPSRDIPSTTNTMLP